MELSTIHLNKDLCADDPHVEPTHPRNLELLLNSHVYPEESLAYDRLDAGITADRATRGNHAVRVRLVGQHHRNIGNRQAELRDRGIEARYGCLSVTPRNHLAEAR
ncbi:MAG TPA: hypothetical protein PK890_01275 [Terrimesophilobacter sp.]|nr:hypothetical protein [Terrimesophilobacter sp.]